MIETLHTKECDSRFKKDQMYLLSQQNKVKTVATNLFLDLLTFLSLCHIKGSSTGIESDFSVILKTASKQEISVYYSLETIDLLFANTSDTERQEHFNSTIIKQTISQLSVVQQRIFEIETSALLKRIKLMMKALDPIKSKDKICDCKNFNRYCKITMAHFEEQLKKLQDLQDLPDRMPTYPRSYFWVPPEQNCQIL